MYFSRNHSAWLSRSCTNLKGLSFHSIMCVCCSKWIEDPLPRCQNLNDYSKRKIRKRTYAKQLRCNIFLSFSFLTTLSTVPIYATISIAASVASLIARRIWDYLFLFFWFEISYDDDDDDVTIGFCLHSFLYFEARLFGVFAVGVCAEIFRFLCIRVVSETRAAAVSFAPMVVWFCLAYWFYSALRSFAMFSP